jgi:hypothetical protein
MNLIPQIVLPFAFASLIQNILMVSQFSEEGFMIIVGTLIGWHLFITKTSRGKMVFYSWTQKVPNENL